MSTFNFKRFCQALKCHFIIEQKAIFRLFGIFTLVVFFSNLFFTRIAGQSYSCIVESSNGDVNIIVSSYKRLVEFECPFIVLFMSIAMLVGASTLFKDMKDTRKRSAFLLWPVSNLEKYIIRVIHSVLVVLVIAVASIVLGEALRVLVDALTGRVIVWALPSLLDPFENIGYWQYIFMVATWTFYIHSLYIVGGSLFRRYHFFLTSVVIFIALVVIGMCLKQIGMTDFDMFEYYAVDGNPYHYRVVFNTRFYIVNGISWAIIAFHYWLSYKIFCRMQVINNKWLNV